LGPPNKDIYASPEEEVGQGHFCGQRRLILTARLATGPCFESFVSAS
jgi:hypothetical protein